MSRSWESSIFPCSEAYFTTGSEATEWKPVVSAFTNGLVGFHCTLVNGWVSDHIDSGKAVDDLNARST